MAGAPIGNQNRAKGAQWRAAIERALERRSSSRSDGVKELDAIADQLLQLCGSGDLPAIKELGDRLDGKAAQPVGGTDDLPPVKMEGILKFVKPE